MNPFSAGGSAEGPHTPLVPLTSLDDKKSNTSIRKTDRGRTMADTASVINIGR